MELVVIVLLILNMAVLGTLVLFCSTVITLLKNQNPTVTVESKGSYTASTYAVDSQVDEEIEKDESVPIEQFTPDFTKPIKIVEEDDIPLVDIDEVDKK
jgi:hypothetical protein